MIGNEELTPRQQRAVACLLEYPTVEAASKKAGVSRSNMYEWLKNPTFKKEVERAKRRQFEEALEQLRHLLPDVTQRLEELCHSSNEHVSLRACIVTLKATKAYGASTNANNRLEEISDVTDRTIIDLSDMSDEAMDVLAEIGMKGMLAAGKGRPR